MDEEIKKIEDELKASSERLREFRKVDAREQILREMSYRQELFDQLLSLKNMPRFDEKDDDIKEYKKLNLKKIEYFNINFDGSNLSYNASYRINGHDGSLFTRLTKNLSSPDKMIRDVAVSRMVDTNFFKIFDGFDPEKIKNYDAKLISVLYSKFAEEYGDETKGIEVCRAYLNQLSLGKNADRSKLPYTIKYNLRSIFRAQFNDGKKLSFINKIRFLKMVKANKYVASIEPERKINKRWVALLAALGLGAGMIALNSGKTKNEQQTVKDNQNVMVDSIEEKATKETVAKPTVQEEYKENIEKESKSWELSQDELQEINEHMNEFINNQENQKKDNQQEIQFGSVMKLNEGIQFTESVFGGRVGIIGSESSPKDGFYVIDHVAQISDTEVSNRYGLSGKIEKNDENSKQYFHISYVEGAKTLEEAQKIIEEQNKDLKDGEVADKNIVKPRGWVSQDIIQKIYKEQKNNQLENQREK